MKTYVHFPRVLQVHLGISVFLAAIAPAVAAQSSVQDQASIGSPAAVAVDLRRSSVPELPPIQPLLPELAPVRLVLKLEQRRVYVYKGEAVQKSYPVAVGRTGWETPTGNFKVMQMLQHPGWTNPLTGEKMPPGPDNPLGERWIAFWTDGTNSIGFHGTPNRESVGRAASHGCVRMFNEDIRDLYEIVKLGTPVTVEP